MLDKAEYSAFESTLNSPSPILSYRILCDRSLCSTITSGRVVKCGYAMSRNTAPSALAQNTGPGYW